MAVHRSSLAALSLAALSIMACGSETTAPSPVDMRAAIRAPLATLDWNHIARSMIEKHKPNQQAAQRGMAYLTLAQYEAAKAAQDVPPKPFTTQGASPARRRWCSAISIPPTRPRSGSRSRRGLPRSIQAGATRSGMVSHSAAPPARRR